jgi:hypothetical protein
MSRLTDLIGIKNEASDTASFYEFMSEWHANDSACGSSNDMGRSAECRSNAEAARAIELAANVGIERTLRNESAVLHIKHSGDKMWHEVEMESTGNIKCSLNTSTHMIIGVALMALDVIVCLVSYTILYQFIK